MSNTLAVELRFECLVTELCNCQGTTRLSVLSDVIEVFARKTVRPELSWSQGVDGEASGAGLMLSLRPAVSSQTNASLEGGLALFHAWD